MYGKMIHVMTLLVVLTASYVGYQFHLAHNKADEYRMKLEEVRANYNQLRETYNDAVRRTAVTELLVSNGRLSVIIRTAEGEIKRIETPCDVSGEVYVDYVVLGGRLWIRRVFDQRTAPEDATVIDPKLVSIDWAAENAEVGKAVYKHLTDGRWVISVSGDGSLGLKPATGKPEENLSPPPPIREFEPSAK